MTGVKEMTLMPADNAANVPVKVETPTLQTQILSLAADPAIDVAKLKELVAMQREQQLILAKMDFTKAMNRAQKLMRPISADATNPQTHSKYATYAKLDKALRPIYTAEGFVHSFDTADSPKGDAWVRVVCNVAHEGGFDKDYRVDMPADGKGARGGDVMTQTHAVGAGLSYGMRYLLKMIWNVAIGEEDRDGNKPPETPEPQAPKGFEDWFSDLKSTADTGRKALSEAFNASKPEFRIYLTKHHLADWEALKVKAATVTANQKAGPQK